MAVVQQDGLTHAAAAAATIAMDRSVLFVALSGKCFIMTA